MKIIILYVFFNLMICGENDLGPKELLKNLDELNISIDNSEL